MKKKHRIFTSEAEIIKEMDDRKATAEELAKESELLDKQKQEHFRLAFELEQKGSFLESNQQRQLGIACEERARSAMKRYRTLTESTIPKLSQALAAFRTKTMIPIMNDYKGVAL